MPNALTKMTVLMIVAMSIVMPCNGETKNKSDWDVNTPPGPSTVAHIVTDQGTWMSLDVSPDGKHIVFDMLGDIYMLGIKGGVARPLTHEIAWNMQPRFSPDGDRIAFTSDRAGGDNIWTMDSDGKNLKQITKESFRLLNSPTWTPDGKYIAARKHFTGTRSLGAGEIWLYHTGAGSGLQMTKRPNDQKDLGEPAFSSDGKYLYFSQDTTPGKNFEYNKDVNKQIYVIKRLDRETGEIEVFINGPGGAIRPTPSPDGKYLAFVRRVRSKSTLFLHEIESGANFAIYDGLDRDMQETWAVHGVYPTIDWMGDSKSIVFWAKGKINRINIKTRKVTDIPFTVDTTRTIAEALRFPVEVHPEKFKAKLLRWVQVSPDRKKVAYQALGRIYVRDLANGKPKRLTTQNEHFEMYPSWARDSKNIVYTTWHDEKLGSVRVISAKGGKSGKVLTNKPGHYIDAVFSPDGEKIVYRKIAARSLRTPTWTRETGIYWVSTNGGDATLITKAGAQPRFANDNDRVFLQGYGEAGEYEQKKRTLTSIKLDGSDERVHFSSQYATEFAVSPDGEYVAFTERFNAYIIPFALTGKTIEISPKTKSIPITKVTRDAGKNLHFSGDSETLFWSLGAELFKRDLNEAFDFLEGAPKKMPSPPAKGLDISFYSDADIPTGVIALVGGRVITMDGDKVIENGTVIIEGNRIAAIGDTDTTDIPAGAYRLDLAGKTIMPGMVDVHAHGPYGSSGIIPQRNWMQYANLAFGVTTNQDPSNDTDTIFAAAELAKAGMITTPRIFSTGKILYGATGSVTAQVDSLDDAISHIRRLKAAGAISVKSYNQPRRDQRQQFITAARKLEMMVVPEGGSTFQHNMTMITDGHTGIEHNIPVATAYDDVIQFWSASETHLTPTLIVGYGGLNGQNYFWEHYNVWENKRLAGFVPQSFIDPLSRRRQKAPLEEYNHFALARTCKKLLDAGTNIHLGGHGELPGLGAHWEIFMFAQGGFTPMECIRAATIHPAHYVGLDGDIGSIETGKLADIIVLDDNPLEDIHNLSTIRQTILNGRIYDAMTMDEIGNHPKKRGPFHWQTDYRVNK